jgi:hypothetical protein
VEEDASGTTGLDAGRVMVVVVSGQGVDEATSGTTGVEVMTTTEVAGTIGTSGVSLV